MLLKLFLAFTLIPLTELYLLVSFGAQAGVGATFLIVIITGILGGWLAKSQGTQTLIKVRNEFKSGSLPAGELLNALLIFTAGLVLITPGFLTDIVGFLLLTPGIRKFIHARISAKLAKMIGKQPNEKIVNPR